MNRKALSVCSIAGVSIWGIIGSTVVLTWEVRSPDTDPRLVKFLILVIVCCALLIALIIGFVAAMETKEKQQPKQLV